VHTQAIALRRAYHEKVPYVVLVLNGRHVEGQPRKPSLVPAGENTTLFGPAGKAAKLVPQYHRLQPVHPVVEPDLIVDVAFSLTMMPE